MILFINACVRQESRTKRLAEHYLKQQAGPATEEGTQQQDSPVTEVDLQQLHFPEVDDAFLAKRDRLCAEGRFDDPMFDLARQFASADSIVIAAPYWDLSFPAVLKQYLEQVCVVGITFCYSPEGIPQGLCRAKDLIYVTTVGGVQLPFDFGYGYVKALSEGYFGIRDFRLISAAGLDLVGADPEKILEESMREIELHL